MAARQAIDVKSTDGDLIVRHAPSSSALEPEHCLPGIPPDIRASEEVIAIPDTTNFLSTDDEYSIAS